MALSIEQAVTVYLINCATERRTTTYEELARQFDLPTTWPQMGVQLSKILYRVFAWCETKRFPKLTALVVRKSGADVDLPGKGFWDVAGLPHVTRNEKILLTEMYTADVYNYFDIPADGVGEMAIEQEL